jgi:anti-anti-sigma factor
VPELSFDITPAGASRLVIAVAGEVDMATAPQLLECLRDHTDRDIILEFSRVAFLDSSGIGAIVQGRNALRDAGRTLSVTGERDNVRTVLEIAGLYDALHHDGAT